MRWRMGGVGCHNGNWGGGGQSVPAMVTGQSSVGRGGRGVGVLNVTIYETGCCDLIGVGVVCGIGFVLGQELILRLVIVG